MICSWSKSDSAVSVCCCCPPLVLASLWLDEDRLCLSFLSFFLFLSFLCLAAAEVSSELSLDTPELCLIRDELVLPEWCRDFFLPSSFLSAAMSGRQGVAGRELWSELLSLRRAGVSATTTLFPRFSLALLTLLWSLEELVMKAGMGVSLSESSRVRDKAEGCGLLDFELCDNLRV